MSTEKVLQKSNLSAVKKLLQTPDKFVKQEDYKDKACFSYAFRTYGCIERWDLALNLLNNLPKNENVFSEVIFDHNKVKPYFDIEWYKEEYPEYNEKKVLQVTKEAIKEVMKTEHDYELHEEDLFVASNHRQVDKNFKYSYHIIVSTHPTIVFENTNKASSLMFKVRNYINEQHSYAKGIIDSSVYKKKQQFRLVGHSKINEFVPLVPLKGTEDPLEYIITNIDKNHIVLHADEQQDHLHKDIQNIDNTEYDDEMVDIIIEKVKLVHPTAVFKEVKGSFMQFNYTDRDEGCFTNDNETVLHEKIGFFVFLKDNNICAGCHSGRCVNEQNKKIIKIIGNIEPQKDLNFEKVDFKNKFKINHLFIKKCVNNGARGMSDLFEEMYLKPKRIKWVNETKNGETYYWDGNLWQQDDYSYIERLVVETIVQVLRDFKGIYIKNPELLNDDIRMTMKKADEIVRKLNDGQMILQILRFIKPMIRDTEFPKIKDIHPYKLSCLNGLVDLKTGEIRPRLPEDNITKTLDINYNPDADLSDFDKFVRDITSTLDGPNEDLYNFLRWLIGYAVQGAPSRKIFIVFYGPYGYNGKSLVINIIRDVLGYYVAAMDSSVVFDNGTKKTAGAHSSELCQLEFARMGLLSDTKEGSVIDDGKIKIITGLTDKMSVREIFSKQKEIRPVFVPFISSNHAIDINLNDKAMYNRLILFPFELSFVQEPKEPYERKGDNLLYEKLMKNKEGVLKFIVDCSMYYHKNKDMPIPKIIDEAKEKYNKKVNIYMDFIDNNIELTGDEKDTISRLDLLERYKEYTRNFGIKIKIRQAETELEKLIKNSKIKGKKHYLGVKFKDEEEIEEEVDELS